MSTTEHLSYYSVCRNSLPVGGYICERFFTGHFLVWWVSFEISVMVMVKISKLLESG